MATQKELDYITPPWNFSWVVDNQLAAMACPESPSNIRYIISEGIKYLVTLSPERKPPVKHFPELVWAEIPVKEFESPTVEQILNFIHICEQSHQKKEAVGIHCRQGKGRTGVMAACYYVRFHDQTPEEAISNIRVQRPGSIETQDQEAVVAKYHHYFHKNTKN